MHRRILAPAAAAVLALGLAACGDNGSNGTVTTPPPDISVEGSDGGGNEPSDGGSDDGNDGGASDGGGDSPTAAPDIPAPDPADYPGMDQNTPEGAEQAFRYYVAVSMWSHQVGDDTLLESLETTDCNSCSAFRPELPALIEANETWSEFEIDDVDVSIHASAAHDHEIGYLFIIGNHTRPDFENGGRQDVPAIEYVTVGGMQFSNGKWLVGGINSEWGPDAHSE